MPVTPDKTREGAIKEHAGLEPEPRASTASELDELRRTIAELQRAQQSQDEKFGRVQRELEENQALVARLMADGEHIDLAAIETRRRNREEARRKIYALVANKKVIIQIHAHDDPRRNYPIHVNLNGKFYNIPRGKPFEIEGEFLEVLDHAYVDHITREVDELGTPHLVHYDLFSYPYTVIRWPDGVMVESSDLIRAAA